MPWSFILPLTFALLVLIYAFRPERLAEVLHYLGGIALVFAIDRFLRWRWARKHGRPMPPEW